MFLGFFFGGGQTMEEMLPDLAAGANVVRQGTMSDVLLLLLLLQISRRRLNATHTLQKKKIILLVSNAVCLQLRLQ